jgi:hypothetical protein
VGGWVGGWILRMVEKKPGLRDCLEQSKIGGSYETWERGGPTYITWIGFSLKTLQMPLKIETYKANWFGRMPVFNNYGDLNQFI